MAWASTAGATTTSQLPSTLATTPSLVSTTTVPTQPFFFFFGAGDDGGGRCGRIVPGHGKSDGAPIFVERFEDFVEDALLFIDIVSARYPAHLPKFILG